MFNYTEQLFSGKGRLARGINIEGAFNLNLSFIWAFPLYLWARWETRPDEYRDHTTQALAAPALQRREM